MKWQIEVFDHANNEWKAFGFPTVNFDFAWSGVKKLQEVGNKVRLRKVA